MGINLGPLVTRNAPLTLSCLCCGRNGCSTGVGGDLASLWKYSVEKYKNCRTASVSAMSWKSRVQGRFKTSLWFALHGHDRMGRKGHEIYMLHRHTHIILNLNACVHLKFKPCMAAGSLRFHLWTLAHPSCQPPIESVLWLVLGLRWMP